MNARALLIFDIDGTLLQSHLITIPAIQQTFASFGLDPPSAEAIQDTFGLPVAEYEAWLAGHGAGGQAGALVEATNQRELELIRETGQLYPGVIEALETLRDAGHTLVACSNGSSAYVNEALEGHRLRAFFQLVRCNGQGFTDKIAMVGDILERIAARPAIVIGDRRGDLEAARAHGARIVAAAYGFGPPEEWADADAFVHSAGEIPGAIVALLGG